MITILTGPNSYLLNSELRRLVYDFVEKHSDLGLEKLDGEEVDFQRISEAINNLPFLASRKLVVLRNPGANKEFSEKFETLIAEIPETNDLIIYESQIDLRTSYAKQLQKQPGYKAFKEVGEKELPKWLVDEAKARGGAISFQDAIYLVNRIGVNQQLLSSELDKLLIYESQITRTSIDLLSEPTPQSTVFQLLEAAFGGDKKRAMKLYDDQRAQRVDPQAIVPMLAWQLQVIAIIKFAGNRSLDDIAKVSKINPYVVKKSKAMADELSLQRVKQLIHDLKELDVTMKSTNIDADEALRHYLLGITA